MSGELSRMAQPFVRVLRGAFITLAGALVFWLIAANRSPNLLRPLSLTMRAGYALVAPTLYILFYLAFRWKGWLGKALSLWLTLAVFGLALAGVWAAGTTESGLLGGLIPMFNSANYYTDALRLLAGQPFSEDSTRRPLFTAFFAFLLWLTGYNLVQALTAMTLLVAIACFLLAREINRTHGPAVASLVLLVVFIYYRYHSGVVRTENLGVLFGALGMAALWRGIGGRNWLYALGGILLTTVGLVARAGAFFILPVLVLWGAFFFRPAGKRLSWRFLAGGLVAILSVFLINAIVTRTFGASGVLPFGNFSYSLYGLATGGQSWATVLQQNPGASDLEIYRMSLRLILEQPGLFFRGMLYNFRMFFSNSSYGLFSYMGGEGNAAATLSYGGLLLLSVLGMGDWFLHRDDPFLGFGLVSALGLLLSVPFLPPTDAFRLRAYAASIVILALLPALGLHTVLRWLHLEQLSSGTTGSASGSALAAFSAVTLVAVVLGPFAVRGVENPPGTGTPSCDPGQSSLVMRYEPSVTVQTLPQNAVALDWAPVFHIGSLRAKIHDFPAVELINWFLENVGPERTLFFGLDRRSHRNALVLVESASLPAGPAWLELCGGWVDDPNLAQFDLFNAHSVHLFEAK